MHTATPDRPAQHVRPLPRDLRLAAGLARGHTYQAIGQHFGMAGPTIRKHVTDLRDRLGAGTRAGIVGTAYHLGWLSQLRPEPRPPARLPRQEQAVLQAAALGMTEAETARLLGVSIHTAHSYGDRILHRLDARNRAHAVALGYQHGHLALPRPGARHG